MKSNQSKIERIIRTILGLGILSLVIIGPKSAWGYLGIIPLATGITGWCPVYQLMSFSTNKEGKDSIDHTKHKSF